MKPGRVLLQALKIGGKMREIRSDAVTLSKGTMGKNLLSVRLEKRIVLGGWKVESEASLPQHPDAEYTEGLPTEAADLLDDDDGQIIRKQRTPILIPKISGGSKRIDAKLPRIGRTSEMPAATRAPQPEPRMIPEPPAIPEPQEDAPKIAAKISETIVKPTKIETKVEEEPVRKAFRSKPKPVEEAGEAGSPLPEVKPPLIELRASEPEIAAEPADVKFQVVPTPRKRQPRIPEPQVESIAPPIPKPIKVIRRRAEEAPKVFETAPKVLPKAMLEGVKLLVEEEGDNPAE